MPGKNVKKRNWSFLVYPESAPSDWVDVLRNAQVPACISPLHDKDVFETGEVKKAHYHVLVCFPGPTTYNNVSQLCESLHTQHPEPVGSIRALYEYMWHKNDPDKAQYDPDEIKAINGFRIDDYATLTKKEIQALKLDIMDYIQSHGMTEYCDLLDGLVRDELLQEFDFATNHTILFDKYLTSRRNKTKQAHEAAVRAGSGRDASGPPTDPPAGSHD